MKEKKNKLKEDEITTTNNAKTGSTIGGLIFVGCMFLGAGIGRIFGDTGTGGMIGMGIGFVIMGIIWAYYSKKKTPQ